MTNAQGGLASMAWLLKTRPPLSPLDKGEAGRRPRRRWFSESSAGLGSSRRSSTPSYFSVSADDFTEDGEQLDASRPPFSFTCLIGLAVMASAEQTLTVGQIYEYIARNFPYFQTAKGTWRNSVRHVLSLNKFFQKPPASHPGAALANASSSDDDAGDGDVKQVATKVGTGWEIKPEMLAPLASQIADGQRLLKPATARHLGLPELRPHTAAEEAAAATRKPRRRAKRQRAPESELPPPPPPGPSPQKVAGPPRQNRAPWVKREPIAEAGVRLRAAPEARPWATAGAKRSGGRAPNGRSSDYDDAACGGGGGGHKPRRRRVTIDGGSCGGMPHQVSQSAPSAAAAAVAAVATGRRSAVLSGKVSARSLSSSSSAVLMAGMMEEMSMGAEGEGVDAPTTSKSRQSQSQSRRCKQGGSSSSSSSSSISSAFAVKAEPNDHYSVDMQSLASSMESIVDTDGGDIFGESINSVFSSSYGGSLVRYGPAAVLSLIGEAGANGAGGALRSAGKSCSRTADIMDVDDVHLLRLQQQAPVSPLPTAALLGRFRVEREGEGHRVDLASDDVILQMYGDGPAPSSRTTSPSPGKGAIWVGHTGSVGGASMTVPCA